jgi:hypothetical protein
MLAEQTKLEILSYLGLELEDEARASLQELTKGEYARTITFLRGKRKWEDDYAIGNPINDYRIDAGLRAMVIGGWVYLLIEAAKEAGQEIPDDDST